MRNQLKSLKKQAGLTSVEYAVAGALLVAAITAAVLAFGPLLKTAFEGLLG